MFGMILGAFFALPLPFDVTSIIASAALGVGVGWLTWYSRESVAGVFMTTASTIAGISTMVALMYVVEAFTQFDASHPARRACARFFGPSSGSLPS
ncbi:hypothetical protein WU85_01520 [Corynebacterium striatum]|nr:hypothetical protein WU85_01520 [Corynebacterium striatum]